MHILQRAVALGFFDGLHIGHAELMHRLTEVCLDTELSPSVLTFDMLPQNLIDNKDIHLINSPHDRVGLIKHLFGIDEVIFLHFDKELASLPWDEFIDCLIIDYSVRHIVAGQNFKFGSGAKGNSWLLRRKCHDSGLGCDIIRDVVYDGVVSSSTYIRSLLLAGNIERANTFLGHPHVLTDVVRSGRKLGSRIGVPTLNMHFAPGVLVPAHGVYATKVYNIESDSNDTKPLTGVTNIGIRPTVDSSGLVTAETHIPGFEQDLYDHEVRIEFHSYLRPEMKFSDTDELKAQVKKDCKAAMKYFKHLSLKTACNG